MIRMSEGRAKHFSAFLFEPLEWKNVTVRAVQNASSI
jgi:hypothetical protein